MSGESFLDNPVIILSLIAIAVVAVVVSALKKNKFKDFKYRPFKKTVRDGLKEKVDLHGQDFPFFSSPGLYIGMKKIAIPEKYFYAKGKFSTALSDGKDIKVCDAENDVGYNLLIVRSSSNNFIFRLLGLKKKYFILKTHEKDKSLITYDNIKKWFFLPINSDLVSYADIWMNTSDAVEYVNDISAIRLVEECMTHIENLPDKIVHLEMEQAKNERSSRVYNDLEKSKYDDIRKASGTTINK